MELKRAERKIEAHQEGEVIGEITYSDTNNGMWIIDHTYVDPAHRNQQIGEQLVAEIVNWARESKRQATAVMSVCEKRVRTSIGLSGRTSKYVITKISSGLSRLEEIFSSHCL